MGGSSAACAGGIPAAAGGRRRDCAAASAPPPPRRFASAATSRNQEDQGREAGLSADRQTAKVQGIVIIEATIGKDGSVKDAKVLRSARCSTRRARRGQPVEVHADPAEQACRSKS
jgi:hypothetical protein